MRPRTEGHPRLSAPSTAARAPAADTQVPAPARRNPGIRMIAGVNVSPRERRLESGHPFLELRKIVADRPPVRARAHEHVQGRSNARIVVEGAGRDAPGRHVLGLPGHRRATDGAELAPHPLRIEMLADE